MSLGGQLNVAKLEADVEHVVYDSLRCSKLHIRYAVGSSKAAGQERFVSL